MTQFDDATVNKSGDGWLNLHDLHSIALGTELTLTNPDKERVNVIPVGQTLRVAESTTAPSSTENFGTPFHPGKNSQLVSSPAAGDATFVISESSSATGLVGVQT